jgi:anti-sigma regulatory factor (Ser/Thr protein kinase)
MDLQLATRQEGTVAVVSASGEIDVFTAPDLDQHLAGLQDAGTQRFVIDLSGVAFLDSTGPGGGGMDPSRGHHGPDPQDLRHHGPRCRHADLRHDGCRTRGLRSSPRRRVYNVDSSTTIGNGVTMATATLTIPPQPEQVRTARLVTTAAARRCGVAEDRIDEIRLAVGEVIARSVLRQQRAGLVDPVVVDITDDGELFTVRVQDATAPDQSDEDGGMAMSVVEALAFECDIHPAGTGSLIRMAWPLAGDILDIE